MKKVLIPVMALLVLFAVTPVMAPATKTPVSGSFLGSADPDVPGRVWTSEEGILQIRGAEGAGVTTGDIPGIMTFTLNAAIDMSTGEGRAWGTYVSTDDYGNTFEGIWLVSVTGYVNIEGIGVGHGTGAYEGMLFKSSFWGVNLYLGGLPPEVPNGVWFDFVGIILSPHT
jgi:hypothetical protein